MSFPDTGRHIVPMSFGRTVREDVVRLRAPAFILSDPWPELKHVSFFAEDAFVQAFGLNLVGNPNRCKYID